MLNGGKTGKSPPVLGLGTRRLAHTKVFLDIARDAYNICRHCLNNKRSGKGAEPTVTHLF